MPTIETTRLKDKRSRHHVLWVPRVELPHLPGVKLPWWPRIKEHRSLRIRQPQLPRLPQVRVPRVRSLALVKKNSVASSKESSLSWVGRPSPLIERRKSRQHEGPSAACLAFTHLTAPTIATPGFGAVLAPLLSGTKPSEIENGISVSCECGTVPNPFCTTSRSTVHCNVCGRGVSRQVLKGLRWPSNCDIRAIEQSAPRLPRRVVVVVELDAGNEILHKLREIIRQNNHPDTHLILYHPSWRTFYHQQLTQDTVLEDSMFANLVKPKKSIGISKLPQLYKNSVKLQSMNASNACRETLKASATIIKSNVKRVTDDSLLVHAMKLSSHLLRNNKGKVVVVKATNTSFPKGFRKWLSKECRHVTVDLLSCCNQRWWKLLPPSLLQRLVKEGGGRFRFSRAYGLDNILKMAFGLETSEVYDASVEFICNPDFQFVTAHG